MRPAQEAQRLCILAEGAFNDENAKTGIGVIRYGSRHVVAVIDSMQAGRDVSSVLGIGHGIPIVCDIREALQYHPQALLIGIAPIGGRLPDSWRSQIITAITNGLHVISGLHVLLKDDPDLVKLATEHHVDLWDVREPVNEMQVAQNLPHRPGSKTVLFVGSDCSVGKMTAALECHREALARGYRSKFIATGQTGIIIAGDGIPLDRIIGDFMPGSVERVVVEACAHYDWVWVEGQGSLIHPAYSPVTLALVHGAHADAMILVHKPDRTCIRHYHIPIPPLSELISLYQQAASWVCPSRVAGIALNTFGLPEQAAQKAIQDAQQAVCLPTTDPVRYGASVLVDALVAMFQTA
jgi:uncharacterized NAD-dependent epimerase/dehydratase family protein